jgi:hypothetical protein
MLAAHSAIEKISGKNSWGREKKSESGTPEITKKNDMDDVKINARA